MRILDDMVVSIISFFTFIWDRMIHGQPIERIGFSFVAISCVIIFFTLSTILIDSSITSRKERKIKRWTAIFEVWIVEYMFGDEEQKMDILNKFNRVIKNNKKAQLLLSKILRDQLLNFDGEQKEAIKDLFYKTDMPSLTLEKLESIEWNYNVEGVREISIFGLEKLADQLPSFAKSKNRFLALESLVAMMDYDLKKAFNLIVTTNFRLSAWEEIVISIKLQNYPLSDLPDFCQWLDLERTDVKVFILKLIRMFKQYQAVEKVSNHISHFDKQVRKEAIITSSELFNIDVLPHLLAHFTKEPKENRLAILDAVKQLGNEHHHEWLLGVFQNSEYSFNTRLKAGLTLKSLGAKTTLNTLEEKYITNHINENKVPWN